MAESKLIRSKEYPKNYGSVTSPALTSPSLTDLSSSVENFNGPQVCTEEHTLAFVNVSYSISNGCSKGTKTILEPLRYECFHATWKHHHSCAICTCSV